MPVEGETSRRKRPPGPRGYPYLGVLPKLLNNRLGVLMDAAVQHGGVAHLGLNWYLISRPEPLKHILQDNARNYRRGLNARVVERLLGNGLPINEGESWLHQRRLMQPAFHKKRIAGLANIMTDVAGDVLQRWNSEIKHDQVVDVVQEIQALMLTNVVRTMFSSNINPAEFKAVAFAVSVIVEYINFVAFLPPMPLWVPTRKNKTFKQVVADLDRIIFRIIDERRRTKEETGDLLSMLLHAQDEDDGTRMDDKQLRDEALSIFIAGYETTASSLIWMLYLLSTQPMAAERLREEVTRVLQGRTPGFEDLSELSYTRMFIDEALRLYPPIWLLSRSPLQDDEVSGYHIPKNAILLFSPYVTHRLPTLWDDPETFDPERFLPERYAKQVKLSYIPFSSGPRQCIGTSFALMALQLTLAMFAQKYRFRLAPNFQVKPEGMVALRPAGGKLLLTIESIDRWG